MIAFTDDDTLPAPDWVERGLECFTTAEADIFAGRIELSPSGSPSIAELVDIGRGYLDQEAMVAEGYGATANLWLRREVAERVGGFREIWSGQSQRFMRSTAGHDRDFCERAVLSGATLAYAPGPVVSHPPRAIPSASWPARSSGWPTARSSSRATALAARGEGARPGGRRASTCRGATALTCAASRSRATRFAA